MPGLASYMVRFKLECSSIFIRICGHTRMPILYRLVMEYDANGLQHLAFFCIKTSMYGNHMIILSMPSNFLSND